MEILKPFTTTPQESLKIVDVSDEEVSSAVPSIIDQNRRSFLEGATRTHYRINRAQAIALALRKDLSQQ